MRNILLVNDDGVFADGLRALIAAFKGKANLTVVAPDQERSAIGHSLTFFSPLRVEQLEKKKHLKVFMTNGKPADCVLLAVHELLDKKPDLLISGINRGPNLGYDISYSGTVSAAFEGMLHGIPSLAVSVTAYENVYYDYAAVFAFKLADFLQNNPLPDDVLLNVNVPNAREGQIKGVELTYQGCSIYKEKLEKRKDPRGKYYYWIGGEKPCGHNEKGSDYHAISQNKISITPLQLNFTAFKISETIKMWDFSSLLEKGE